MKEIIKIILSFILFVVSLMFDFPFYINSILYIVSYLLVGLEVIIKAFKNIFKGEIFDECFLMSIATIGAFIIGEYPEAVAVMLFYQIGELFQDYAVDKSKKSIASLMDIRPDYAFLYKDGNSIKVNPSNVKVGDIIIVSPGEKIPLDGIVVEGESSLDTKALTGETIPRDISVNSEVFSGCINLNGVIKIRVTKEYSESTVSKILDLVENASNKKSKSENFITVFAKYYTPIVVLIALLIGLSPIVTHEDFYTWVYRALSFLVMSCPCSLVISIPLSFFGGIGGASKIGVLIKGSNYIEKLSKVNTVVFDKTGTLTKGVFTVCEINALDKDNLLELAAIAENYSTHPIAVAIKTFYNKKIDEKRIINLEEIPGYGIKANIDNSIVLVGNKKFLDKENINIPNIPSDLTIVFVAVDNVYKGYIVIADEIKNDVATTICELKNNNIKKTVMLTGDIDTISRDVASAINVDLVYTELLPQDKVKKVEELLANNCVAFVGDGINDAPVLAITDVGIAMGAMGSDSAIEAADVVIMNDELEKIVSTIKLSKRTMRIVRENIIFAISVKILVLILSILGISTMWEAVIADVGVTVIAILNALRVLNVKKIK